MLTPTSYRHKRDGGVIMGGWGCPHEADGRCQRVQNRPCDPGMKGCVLAGRFVFSSAAKNTARALRNSRKRQADPARKPRDKS
jgi:hypothetical protein